MAIQRQLYHDTLIDAYRAKHPKLEGLYKGVQLGFAFGKAEELSLGLLIDGNQDAVDLGETACFDAAMIFIGVTDY